MSYKLDIQDDLMSIQGLYGTYEASNNEKGGFYDICRVRVIRV